MRRLKHRPPRQCSRLPQLNNRWWPRQVSASVVRVLRNETGVGAMIATPAVTLFAVEQRAVFDIQIPKSMQLWKPPTVRKPKSHEEFMSQIIKANSIQLPELPAGKIYRYHPERCQLYVHPANE